MQADLYLTQSEVQTWLRCRRKWWLSIYRRMQIKTLTPHGARALGTNIHDALAAKYATGADPVAVFKTTYARIMAELPDEYLNLAEAVRKDFDLGVIMLEGYQEWVAEEGIDEGLEVVGVEERVDVPFRPEMRLLGKMDLRVRTRFDQRRFLDHKSVGSLTEPLKTLHMDVQMKHYHLLEYLKAIEEGLDPTNGTMCDGGLYNMLRKVKRTKTATPPFYAREDIGHNVHELRRYFEQLWEVSTEILRARERLDRGENGAVIMTPVPAPSCSWSCEWFHVCNMFDDGSDAERFLGDMTIAHDPLERYNERSDEI